MGWDKHLFTKTNKRWGKENNSFDNYLYMYYAYIQNEWHTTQLLTTCQRMPSQSSSNDGSSSQLPTTVKFFFTWCPMVWTIPLASLSCRLCPLPKNCAPHCQSSTRSWETEKSLALYRIAQQQRKRQYIISTGFLFKPKHSIIPETVKEKPTLSQLRPAHTEINTISIWKKKKKEVDSWAFYCYIQLCTCSDINNNCATCSSAIKMTLDIQPTVQKSDF